MKATLRHFWVTTLLLGIGAPILASEKPAVLHDDESPSHPDRTNADSFTVGQPIAALMNLPKVERTDFDLDRYHAEKAISEGKSPKEACFNMLEKNDPERLKAIEWEQGRRLTGDSHLPAEGQKEEKEKRLPPLMQDVSQCQNTHKIACMKLLERSLSNPRQMAKGSRCNDDTREKFKNLLKENFIEDVDFSSSSSSVNGADLETPPIVLPDGSTLDWNKPAFENDIFSKYRSSETCANQAEMSMEIVGALDGDPESRLESLEKEDLLNLLKDINPSAHEAIMCMTGALTEFHSADELGVRYSADGQKIGSITGVPYGESLNERGFLGPVIVFCRVNPKFCTTAVGATVAWTWGKVEKYFDDKKDEEEKKNEREQKEKDRQLQKEQQEKDRQLKENEQKQKDERWKWEHGLDSEYGIKPGCDGKGSCESEDNTEDEKIKPPSKTYMNPDEWQSPSAPVKKCPNGVCDSPKNYDPNISDKTEFSVPIPNGFLTTKLKEGSIEEACEDIYQKAEIGQNMAQISNEKIRTYNQDYYRELGKEKDPIDLNELKSEILRDQKEYCDAI